MADKLQDKLAAHLESGTHPWLALTEVNVGDGRADVLAVNFSYNTRWRIYECKVTRSDFMRDVNSRKYEKYLPYCSQLFFCVPRGLVTLDEVPEGCGLMVYSEDKGFRTIVAPPVREFTPPSGLLLLCLFRKQEMRIEGRRLTERVTLNENAAIHEQVHNLGMNLRVALSRLQDDKDDVRRALNTLQQITGEQYTDVRKAATGIEQWAARTFGGVGNLDMVGELMIVARDLLFGLPHSEDNEQTLRQLVSLINHRIGI